MIRTLTLRNKRKLRVCDIIQFYHICLEDVNSLLQHWTWRQAAGEIPFWFKQVEKADRHGKQVLAADRTPIGAGSGDQLELELKDAHGDEECLGGAESLAMAGADQQGQGTSV
jgi:hypothetical protein